MKKLRENYNQKPYFFTSIILASMLVTILFVKVVLGWTNPAGNPPTGAGAWIPTVQNDVTASKGFDNVYQNNTGKVLYVSVVGKSTSAPASIAGFVDSNSSPAAQVSISYNYFVGDYASVFFMVLPGNYYKVLVGYMSLYRWTEWN